MVILKQVHTTTAFLTRSVYVKRKSRSALTGLSAKFWLIQKMLSSPHFIFYCFLLRMWWLCKSHSVLANLFMPGIQASEQGELQGIVLPPNTQAKSAIAWSQALFLYKHAETLVSKQLYNCKFTSQCSSRIITRWHVRQVLQNWTATHCKSKFEDFE